MRLYIFCTVVLVAVLLPTPVSAQFSDYTYDQATGKWMRASSTWSKTYDKHFWASSAVYWTGSSMDIASSWGQQEASPLWKKHDGTFNAPLNLGITAGIYGVSVIFQKKSPKFSSFLRYFIGGARAGVGVRNYIVTH